MAHVLRAVGELHLARGAAAQALAAFERAARIFAQRGDEPHELDLARFGVARALWITGRDRPRAVELARNALTSLEAAHVDDEAARIRAWLATTVPAR